MVALLLDRCYFRFLYFFFLENCKTIFVFRPWKNCKRILGGLLLRHLRLLSPGRTASIRDRLELGILGSWEIYWFLWFWKLGAAFSKVAVYMTEVAFKRDLLIVHFLNVAPFS